MYRVCAVLVSSVIWDMGGGRNIWEVDFMERSSGVSCKERWIRHMGLGYLYNKRVRCAVETDAQVIMQNVVRLCNNDV